MTAAEFQENLPEDVTRGWLGPDFWTANHRMHEDNWRLHQGRIECVDDSEGNKVHLLTHQLAERDGTLEMSVRTGALKHKAEGYVGFMFAATGAENEYRVNFHGTESGIPAGITHEGKLLIGQTTSESSLSTEQMADVLLQMKAQCQGNQAQVTLRAFAPDNPGEPLAELRETVEKTPMAGNLTLICHGKLENWFDEWKVGGDKVDANPRHRFGPILWTQYTLHENILKMSAYFPPMDPEKDTRQAALEIKKDGQWTQIAEAEINPNGKPGEWTGKVLPFALFRVENWDDTRDTPFRVVYQFHTAEGLKTETWEGVVRKNPVEKPVLKLSAVTGMGNMVFPNHHMQANLLAHDPDVAYFSGDNVYGHNYAYYGWSFRELLRDRPSICTPDDHDVGEDDLWGRGGELRPKGKSRLWGGYKSTPEAVNQMHRLQTAHLPDPYNPEAGKNGIIVYFTGMTYGRVSFGIIDDRHFKSGPEQAFEKLIEPWGVKDIQEVRQKMRDMDREKFEPEVLDDPSFHLLGEAQLKFLEDWAADWQGTDMKIVLHQSPFCQSANYGGGPWPPDLDANGWPQTGRNRALRVIRKGFAPTVSGDTHLGMLMQQGVEEFRDAAWQYVSPAGAPVSNRSWNPRYPGENHVDGLPDYTGDYLDAFGNKMTVWAVSNQGSDFAANYREPDGSQVDLLQERVAGYGIIEFDKTALEYTFNNYPIYDAETPPAEFQQYPDWPRTVPMAGNYDATPSARLPEIALEGRRPVVQVLDSAGEVLYTRRVTGESFQPPVFAPGQYTVRIGEPGTEGIVEKQMTAEPVEE